MPQSWTLVLIVAVLVLSWAVGAYNRLVRLRAAVVQAFHALDIELCRQTDVVQASLPASMQTSSAPMLAQPTDRVEAQWLGLHGALNQFRAALVQARQRPLDQPALAALAAGQQVLLAAVERMACVPAASAHTPRAQVGPVQLQRMQELRIAVRTPWAMGFSQPLRRHRRQ